MLVLLVKVPELDHVPVTVNILPLDKVNAFAPSVNVFPVATDAVAFAPERVIETLVKVRLLFIVSAVPVLARVIRAELPESVSVLLLAPGTIVSEL